MAGFNSEIEKMAAPPLASMAQAALSGGARVAKNIGGVLSRTGQRQVHALTGWTPKAGIQSIRGGSYDAGERLMKARKAMEEGASNVPSFMDRALGRSPNYVKNMRTRGLTNEVAKSQKALGSAQAAESMGLTSLPGYAKSLATAGVGKTMKAGFREQWDNTGPVGRALMVGFPAVGVGGELARDSKPGESGRLSRAGSRLGDAAFMMGPIPFAGHMAAAAGIGGAGKLVGGMFDKRPSQPAMSDGGIQ